MLQPEGEDELKRRQLMELAIINGTYRDTKSGPNTQAQANGASPPSSLSPLGGGGGHPAALAAVVASRKWHGVVPPYLLACCAVLVVLAPRSPLCISLSVHPSYRVLY